MTRDDVSAALLAWKAGTVRPSEAIARTMPYWRAVAAKLYRRWRAKLPNWYTGEDVLQDVLVELGALVDRYEDRGPGCSIAGWVTQGALLRAEKRVHEHRGVVRTPGYNPRVEPSHVETSVEDARVPGLTSDLEHRQRPRAVRDAGRVEATQDDVAGARLVFERARARATRRSSAALAAALRESEGELAIAAEMLYDDPVSRLACELGSEMDARRLLGRELRRIARDERIAV